MDHPHGNTRYDPAQTCQSVMDWCAKGIDYTKAINNRSHLSEEQKRNLDQWRNKLLQLQAKATAVFRSNPLSKFADTNQLIHEGHLLSNGFTQFIRSLKIPSFNTRFAAANPTTTSPPTAVPIGGHTLPPLPYPYNALEPYIDEQTMRLHHDKHHQSYVDGLNKAEQMMQTARKTGNFDLIAHWEREAAFNGAGHYLHTIFWGNMKPKGGGEPTGSLLAQIKQDFGSFSDFKRHFSAAAEKVEGGGWAILIWSPRARRLEILQAEKHQNLSQWDNIPLLVLDVWEHAYYLKYLNDRKAYIEAWWNVVNWDDVQDRFEKARQLTWKPY